MKAPRSLRTRLVQGLVLWAAALVAPGGGGSHPWVRVAGATKAPALPPPPPSFSFTTTFDAGHFLKGNLHTHTLRSDGDAPPEEVIATYRALGYDFLVLSDHNRFTSTQMFASLEDERFHVLSGEEVTMRGGGRQVHVNAICTTHRIGGGVFPTAASALSWAIGQVGLQHGVALVNHPNFDRALEPLDLVAASGASLLEVMSGHPYVYSLGTKGRPAHEAFWDFALAEGMGFMGVAVDDLHHLRVNAEPPAFAGRGWVEVFGERNDEAVICDALRAGRLYASTGVALRRIQVTDSAYTVWPDAPSAVVSFIGEGGQELSREGPLAEGASASYRPRASDQYVRARVELGEARAWTPAVTVTRVVRELTRDVSAKMTTSR